MTLLLDTHVFQWYITSDAKLPITFRDAIRDPSNNVYLSVAAIWEAVIKFALGKPPLPKAPADYLPKQRDAHGILSLPIDEAVFTHLEALPSLHRDPFDRMMIAQTIQHGMTLTTADHAVRAYPVTLLPMS